MNKSKINFAFFGTDEFSVYVLDELKKADLIPSLIITAPDRKQGRGLKLQSPEVKIWAEKNNIDFIQPESFDQNIIDRLKSENFDLFTLASYGKIIPQEILDLPKKGSLNVHPSLLPLFRGASPIETAILKDSQETGVTIMLMDDKMDHGPILNQEFVYFEKWPNTKKEIKEQLGVLGGKLLAETIPYWMTNQIEEQEQDHTMASFTKKIKKEDGLINFKDSDRTNFLKIIALNPWPSCYFFLKKDSDGNKLKQEIRIKITSANFENNKLQIEKVIPEGKSEMTFSDFCKNYNFNIDNFKK